MFVLFLARKSDQWFAVDPTTGTKLHSFTPDGVLGTCPIVTSPAGTLYIGRRGKHLPLYCKLFAQLCCHGSIGYTANYFSVLIELHSQTIYSYFSLAVQC